MNSGNAVLNISDLVDYEAQPFKVFDNDSMFELAESIKSVGVLVPITVRPMCDGKYEIISGHRRKRACELANINVIPAVIKELDDAEAAIMLVDSNLQRENILPSERAYAYRLKLEALKHQGKTSGHNVRNLETADALGIADGKTGRQVRRYIRLTELIDPLLKKVDEGTIPITVGTELSYLNVKWQLEVYEILERELITITIGQALKIKSNYQKDTLTDSLLTKILMDKYSSNFSFKIDSKRLRSYFPVEYTDAQCEELLWEILECWKNK